MNKDSLLLFMKRILACGSPEKSSISLIQLREILELQGADTELINLVNQTAESMPEVKEAAKKEFVLTEKSLLIAIHRAEARKRMEEEMRSRGRC